MSQELAKGRLRSFVERVERLEAEKGALAEDVREVYSEAGGEGFDVKTLRRVIARRKMDTAERQEADSLLEIYERTLAERSNDPLD